MSTKSKAIIKKLSGQFKAAVIEETQFFKKPTALIALVTIAVAALIAYQAKLKSKIGKKATFDLDNRSELNKFLKSDPLCQAILKQASNDLDEDALSDLLLLCSNTTPEYIENQIPDIDFSSSSIFDTLQYYNDVEKKISKYDRLMNNLTKFYDKIEAQLPIFFLMFFIISEMIRLFTQTEYPSKYRAKYLQKLIRATMSVIKQFGAEFKDWYEMLKKADTMLIGILLATTVYVLNRMKLQGSSEEVIKQYSCLPINQAVSNITPRKITIASNLNLNDFCSIDPDDVLVPKQPFEDKLINMTCEIPEEGELQIDDAQLKPELAYKAIVSNQRKEKMISKINVGTQVNMETVIASLNRKSVYSPVNGVIESVKTDKIVISDISDGEDNLSALISSLSEKYQEMNQIKVFLKDYQLLSVYPVMVWHSPEIDKSLDKSKAKYHKVSDRYDNIIDDWNKTLKDYRKNVQTITGEKNVKKHAENETTHLIKEQLDKEELRVSKELIKLNNRANNEAKITIPKSSEYSMIEYYLYTILPSLVSIKEPDKIQKAFREKITAFAERRYIIDGYRPKLMQEKINDLIDTLEKGITLGDWFAKGEKKYNERKSMDDLKNWLQSIADKNNKLDAEKKIELVEKLTFLYQFYFSVDVIKKKYPELKNANQKQEVITEASYISNYFAVLNKRYVELPKEIAELEYKIDSMSMFSHYSIIEEENEQYRNYVIADPNTACLKGTSDYTETDYGNIKYWLKYCAFATLASVTNPATGWSTGIVLPIGPIMLPTVYIPVKPIATKYGWILFGLTITGLWLFPMLLFVNFSSNYALPIADPTTALKKEVEETKKTIMNQLKNLRRVALKEYLDKIAKETENKKKELEAAKEAVINHENLKPPQKPIKAYTDWLAQKTVLIEYRTEVKMQKWSLERKYKMVYLAYKLESSLKKGNESDKSIEAMKNTEAKIDAQFDKLNLLVDKIDKMIAGLPITLQPDTANFGFTLKNPKPVINIAKDLDDNINNTALDKIAKPFKLKNADMMNKKYDSLLSKSVINFNKYKSVLTLGNMSIITKDPFPAYEKLKMTNVYWLSFLYKDFVTTGAKTYGIPGQMPIPVS